jgi:hypothetical protein
VSAVNKSAKVVLAGEYAQVAVSVDNAGNGPRLRIEDLRTGHVGFLDPLELECLAWTTKDELAPLLDPAATRWKSVTGDDLELRGDAPAN